MASLEVRSCMGCDGANDVGEPADARCFGCLSVWGRMRPAYVLRVPEPAAPAADGFRLAVIEALNLDGDATDAEILREIEELGYDLDAALDALELPAQSFKPALSPVDRLVADVRALEGCAALTDERIGRLIVEVGTDVVRREVEAWSERDLRYHARPDLLFLVVCRAETARRKRELSAGHSAPAWPPPAPSQASFDRDRVVAEGLDAIEDRLRAFDGDEPWIALEGFRALVGRLEIGRAKHGTWDLDDARDYSAEAAEEALDFVNYTAAATVNGRGDR